MTKQFIQMSDIVLSFHGHTILNHVSFSLKPGEICAILGENAAGKSSLMKILSGFYTPDQGDVTIDGARVTHFSVTEMQKRGIFLIQQTSQLIDFFTVEENIFIGQEQNYPHIPLVNKKSQLAQTKELMAWLNCPLEPLQKIQDLSASMKILVEIAKALVRGVKVLILDEITASVSAQESAVVFQAVEKLAASGVGVVFISHRLDDVLSLSNRLVIMRDGALIDDQPTAAPLPGEVYQAVLQKMVGPDFEKRYPKTKAKTSELLLRITGAASANHAIKRADFYIRRGEIVGIAGLQGSGKTQLARLIAGLEPVRGGTRVLAYHPMHGASGKNATIQTAFLSAVADENQIIEHSIEHNVTLPALSGFRRGLLLNRKKCYYHTDNVLKKYHISNASPSMKSKFLSSGSLQKVSIAKLLNTSADVLVMDEPSNTLDISSKVDLYNIMNNLTHQGYAICFTSSDISELMGMCDRIYVMFEGSTVAEFNAAEVDSVQILTYATGHLSG